MNFSALIFPIVVFTIVFLITWLGYSFWATFFGEKNRALRTRLREFSELASNQKERSIQAKDHQASHAPIWFFDLQEKYPSLEKVDLLIIRSGLQLSITDLIKWIILIFFCSLGFLSLIGVGFLLSSIVAIVISFSPFLYLARKGGQRKRIFEQQLPDALDYMSRALKAGHALSISMGMAGDELPEPIGRELKITFDQLNFGLPFQEALMNLTLRVDSDDLKFFVIALNIQRDTGGNLTELLGNLAKTIRERIKLSGKIRVLASEGKFSGIILFIFPFLMATVLTLINPKYMSVLWSTPIGNNLILIGLIMMSFGGFWISQIVKIKV